MAGAATAPQMTPQQFNSMARQAILNNAVEMVLPLAPITVTGTPIGQTVFNITPRFVGLTKGFIIKLKATISNTAGATGALTPSAIGAPNILQQVVFNDLNNNVRIQTTGWHLYWLASIKRRRPWGVSFTAGSNDYVAGFGNNYTCMTQTASISVGGTGTILLTVPIPLAYGDEDL